MQDGHARGLPVAKKPQFPVDPTLPLAQRVPQDGDAESAALVADPPPGCCPVSGSGADLVGVAALSVQR